eukprot:751508-Hanusia_phi.AAC.2
MSTRPLLKQQKLKNLVQPKFCRRDFLKLKHMFDELDADKNGFLDSSEFAVFIRIMGIMVSHESIDKNHDGVIDFKEMLQFVYPAASPSAIQSICREHADSSNEHQDGLREGLVHSQLEEIRQLFEFHARGEEVISRERLMAVALLLRAYCL